MHWHHVLIVIYLAYASHVSLPYAKSIQFMDGMTAEACSLSMRAANFIRPFWRPRNTIPSLSYDGYPGTHHDRGIENTLHILTTKGLYLKARA